MRPIIATGPAALRRTALALGLVAAALPARAAAPFDLAQAEPPGSPAPLPTVPPNPGVSASPQEEGADQVVGLFAATCLKFPGDVAGLRGFLTSNGAPAMPPQASRAFLGNRAGQVFDTSYQGTRLALVSLDGGGCEAVAEFAGPDQVVDYLGEAMHDLGIAAQPQGTFTDPQRRTVQQHVWRVELAGRAWLVSAVTAPQAPQASLGLSPLSAAPAR